MSEEDIRVKEEKELKEWECKCTIEEKYILKANTKEEAEFIVGNLFVEEVMDGVYEYNCVCVEKRR